MTAILTDATSHACVGPECMHCGEPRELMLLRRVRIRPVLEAHADAGDVALAQLVTDELRPLLLAALRIREMGVQWEDSSTAALAEAGRHIVRQFRGTPWEVEESQQEVIPAIQEIVDSAQHVNPDDLLHAPPQAVRQPPPGRPRVCRIVRTKDVTGISGIGVIGEGFIASDGSAAWRWFDGPPQHQPKWESYDNPGPEPFEQISGHMGNTKLEWLDEPGNDESPR